MTTTLLKFTTIKPPIAMASLTLLNSPIQLVDLEHSLQCQPLMPRVNRCSGSIPRSSPHREMKDSFYHCLHRHHHPLCQFLLYLEWDSFPLMLPSNRMLDQWVPVGSLEAEPDLLYRHLCPLDHHPFSEIQHTLRKERQKRT